MSIIMPAQCSSIAWVTGTSMSRQTSKGAATACPHNTKSVMNTRNLEGFLCAIWLGKQISESGVTLSLHRNAVKFSFPLQQFNTETSHEQGKHPETNDSDND